MKTTKIILVMVFVLVLLPSALALSKPIAGSIPGAVDSELNIFVTVSSPIDGEQLCVISPTIRTGPTGDYATNLENLVFADSPSVKCNTFWSAGDPIWFEANIEGSFIVSSTFNIESGTGLQMLNLAAASDTNQGSSGGESAGSISIPSQQIVEEKFSAFDPLILETQLSLIQLGDRIKSNLDLSYVSGNADSISVELVLASLPNNDILEVTHDGFFYGGSVVRQYFTDTSSLEYGRYYLQALVYQNGELIASSNRAEFFVGTVPENAPSVSGNVVVSERLIDYNRMYLLLVAVIILIILIFLVLELRKSKI